MGKVLLIHFRNIGRVGKTSLTIRYCKSDFDDNQESTINASYLEKSVNIDRLKETVNLAIWVYLNTLRI